MKSWLAEGAFSIVMHIFSLNKGKVYNFYILIACMTLWL